MPLQPEQMLSHYRLIEKIGEGGMGIVWKAEDTKLRRPVALKVLPPDLMANDERRLRFLREARTAAAVNHANIAHVYEINEAEGIVFITMELVMGKTLRLLLGGKALPLKQTLRIATEMAEALAEAHKARVIHRDLKPENVIVDTNGHVKLLDFGLAKLHEDLDEIRRSELSHLETVSGEMTREGKVFGTPAYMSPEQARGKPVDRRSDLFAFGITLYEMSTGLVPFKGRTTTDILSAILRDEPLPADDINPDLPPEMGRIISKCLEKEPKDRYQHTDELALDLRHLRQSTDSGVQRVRTPSGPISTRRSRLWTRRTLLPVVLTVVLAVSGLITWRALHSEVQFQNGDRLLVADFDDRTARPGVDAALRDALEDMLGQSSLVQVVRRRELGTRQKAGNPDYTSRIDGRQAETSCRQGLCSGYVVGSLSEESGGYRLQLEVHDVGFFPASVSHNTRIESDDELLRGLHDLVMVLRRDLGEAPQILAGSTPPTTDSLAAYQAYAIGNQMDDYETTIPQYREAVRIDPEFIDGHQRLAGTLQGSGRCRESRDAFAQVCSRLSHLPESARRSAELQCLLSFYEFDGAMERLQILHHRNPLDPAVLGDLSSVEGWLGDHPAELEYEREQYRVAPDYWSLRDLAFGLTFTGHWAEIEPLVDEFAASGATAARVSSLRLLSDLGRLDVEAMPARLNGLESEGEIIHGTSAYLHIWALVITGRFSEAEEAIADSWRAGLNRSDRMRRLETSLWKAWIEARRTGGPPTPPADIVALSSECAEFLSPLATYCADEQLPDVLEPVIASYENESKLSSSKFIRDELAFARGCLALTRRQPARAIELLEPLARFSSRIDRHHVLARAYEAAGMLEQAAKEYQIVLREPQNKLLVVNPASVVMDEARLAGVYEQLGDREQAVQWYERFVEDWKDADPDIPELIAARARLAEIKEADNAAR